MVRRTYRDSASLWRNCVGVIELSEEEELRRINDQRRWRTRYELYMLSKRWSNIREKVLSRDGYACVRCGSKKFLQVDHKKYVKFGEEWLEDLQTLCILCHAEKTAKFDMKTDVTYKALASRRVLLRKIQLFEVGK